MSNDHTSGLELRSLIKADGTLEVSLARVDVPEPAADGVVVLAAAQPFSLEGHLLIIDHGAGLNSAFLHCDTLKVKVGDVVHQGQVIATVGMTGRATGPHLHWSVTWRGARLDPLLLAGPMSQGAASR